MAKHRRGRSTTSAAPRAGAALDWLPLSLPDVYLLTAESDGHEAVGGLTVVVDGDGLTVFAPHGAVAAMLPWSELTILRTVGPTSAPGGGEAVFLEASGGHRTHRFIVPTENAGALEATIAGITGIPPAAPPRRGRRRG